MPRRNARRAVSRPSRQAALDALNAALRAARFPVQIKPGVTYLAPNSDWLKRKITKVEERSDANLTLYVCHYEGRPEPGERFAFTGFTAVEIDGVVSEDARILSSEITPDVIERDFSAAKDRHRCPACAKYVHFHVSSRAARRELAIVTTTCPECGYKEREALD